MNSENQTCICILHLYKLVSSSFYLKLQPLNFVASSLKEINKQTCSLPANKIQTKLCRYLSSKNCFLSMQCLIKNDYINLYHSRIPFDFRTELVKNSIARRFAHKVYGDWVSLYTYNETQRRESRRTICNTLPERGICEK